MRPTSFYVVVDVLVILVTLRSSMTFSNEIYYHNYFFFLLSNKLNVRHDTYVSEPSLWYPIRSGWSDLSDEIKTWINVVVYYLSWNELFSHSVELVDLYEIDKYHNVVGVWVIYNNCIKQHLPAPRRERSWVHRIKRLCMPEIQYFGNRSMLRCRLSTMTVNRALWLTVAEDEDDGA